MWFTKFDAFIHNNLHADVPSQDLRDRVLQLKKTLRKNFKRAIQGVLELANQVRLRDLNMTQQQTADYLRTSRSTALAKRNFKNEQQQKDRGDDDSVVQQFAKVITDYKTCVSPSEPRNTECSYYSLYSNSDMFTCISEQDLDVDKMEDFDVLRVFGLLGVCYSHKPSDFVDPYLFYIDTIVGGVYLSLADLREVNNQTVKGVTAELRGPGSDTTITGVVPLRCLDLHLFDIVWTSGMKILEAHTSLNMRRMLAHVRSDMLGERIGVLMHIMHRCTNNDMSSWDQLVFDDILSQLKMLLELPIHKHEFSLLMSHIAKQHNFRDMLTGVQNISCIQKPMIALLCFGSSVGFPSSTYINDMLSVLYEFEAYHRARHQFHEREERHVVMMELLNVDRQLMLEWFPLKQIPSIPVCDDDGVYRHINLKRYIDGLMDDNKQWKQRAEKINLDVVQRQCQWMPKVANYQSYSRVLGRFVKTSC